MKLYKLTDDQKNQHAELKKKLSKAHERLTDAISTYNDSMRDAWNDVRRAMEEYNNLVESCNDFREEVFEEISEFMDELPDNNAHVEAYAEMAASWSEDLAETDIPEPDELEDFDDDTDSFDDLPGVEEDVVSEEE